MLVVTPYPDAAHVTFSSRLQMKDHTLILYISTKQGLHKTIPQKRSQESESQADILWLWIVHKCLVFAGYPKLGLL